MNEAHTSEGSESLFRSVISLWTAAHGRFGNLLMAVIRASGLAAVFLRDV